MTMTESELLDERTDLLAAALALEEKMDAAAVEARQPLTGGPSLLRTAPMSSGTPPRSRIYAVRFTPSTPSCSGTTCVKPTAPRGPARRSVQHDAPDGSRSRTFDRATLGDGAHRLPRGWPPHRGGGRWREGDLRRAPPRSDPVRRRHRRPPRRTARHACRPRGRADLLRLGSLSVPNRPGQGRPRRLPVGPGPRPHSRDGGGRESPRFVDSSVPLASR